MVELNHAKATDQGTEYFSCMGKMVEGLKNIRKQISKLDVYCRWIGMEQSPGPYPYKHAIDEETSEE